MKRVELIYFLPFTLHALRFTNYYQLISTNCLLNSILWE